MLVFLALGRYSSSFESLILITNFSALPAPAARQRPVIGFNQLSPRQDYSLNADQPQAARWRPVVGLNQMSPRGDYVWVG